MAIPEVIHAQPRSERFNLRRAVQRPVAFFFSIMHFTPLDDSQYNTDRTESSDETIDRVVKKIKVTGDLNRGRPGDDGSGEGPGGN